jgi:hypothetical protein
MNEKELREQLKERDAEIGRLHEQIGRLHAELDQAAERLESAVRTAVAEAERDLKEELQRLTADRDRLAAEPVAGFEIGETDLKGLASGFAEVLDVLAEQPSATGADHAVALSGLEVEARAVLDARPEGTVLMTPKPGAVDPGQLSTLRLSFRVVPQNLPPPVG